jgi:hypothetical protein
MSAMPHHIEEDIIRKREASNGEVPSGGVQQLLFAHYSCRTETSDYDHM